MLLRPKRTKFNKAQRGSLKRVESFFCNLRFGQFGLYSQESGFLSARQIEAARQVISRYLKRKGKVWIRVYPDFPMTSKPTEVRMGKGKGAVKAWFCRVKRGMTLFEVDGVPSFTVRDAFNAATKKLALKTFIYESSWKTNKKI